MKKITSLLNSASFFAATIFGQTAAEQVRKMAELFVSAYNAKHYAQIGQQFNARMKAAVPGEKLDDFLDSLRGDFGKITNLGAPDFTAPAAAKAYSRSAGSRGSEHQAPKRACLRAKASPL